jgi:hypothetical protein
MRDGLVLKRASASRTPGAPHRLVNGTSVLPRCYTRPKLRLKQSDARANQISESHFAKLVVR